jgi:hypothetical protein
MNLLRLAESAAWIGGLLLFGWIIRDAWRTGRSYDERLLLSSREGEIEKDLGEVVAGAEPAERRADDQSGPRPP